MTSKTKKQTQSNAIPLSEAAIRRNGAIVDYISTSMSALSGSTAGLLGLTGLNGFIFYFVCAFISWLLLLTKAGTDWEKYFQGRLQLLTQGLFSGLFTYVLFWTFIYGMVHVY